ncbi:hypothetical protein IFM89_035741 [Coptis chinensis]|uniref:Uncharacterized protein n=1 Tax=Coptis chinensis TaxID=261450 RepID=A0A835H2N6_9MAGN|nr:hypothetical protein IFM89_035741 [Coptis chinensis]
MGMQKPAKQGYEEKVPDEHRMRIIFSCKNVKNLEKVCDDLMTGAKTGTLKVKGLVRIPTKVAKIVVKHGIQNTNNKIMAEELKDLLSIATFAEQHEVRECFIKDLQLGVKGGLDVYASLDKNVGVENLEGDNKYHAGQHGLQGQLNYGDIGSKIGTEAKLQKASSQLDQMGIIRGGLIHAKYRRLRP